MVDGGGGGGVAGAEVWSRAPLGRRDRSLVDEALCEMRYSRALQALHGEQENAPWAVTVGEF